MGQEKPENGDGTLTNANVCCLVEPLTARGIYNEFHERIRKSRTKQDMLNACHAFVAFHGGFSDNPDVSRKIRGC